MTSHNLKLCLSQWKYEKPFNIQDTAVLFKVAVRLVVAERTQGSLAQIPAKHIDASLLCSIIRRPDLHRMVVMQTELSEGLQTSHIRKENSVKCFYELVAAWNSFLRKVLR
jgi:hypothetical protein